MTEFLETAFRLPAAAFSVLLAVVVVYWVVVMLGALGVDVFDGDDGDLGAAGLLASLGLGGVPVSVILSLMIAFSWFVTFVGTALFDAMGAGGLARLIGSVGVVVAAVVAAYGLTYLLVLPLRRAFPDVVPPSRADFVGRECVVRTATVDEMHGQAEVTAADGSSAIIPVRQTGGENLRAGSVALIFDYDTDGEFFWITAAGQHH